MGGQHQRGGGALGPRVRKSDGKGGAAWENWARLCDWGSDERRVGYDYDWKGKAQSVTVGERTQSRVTVWPGEVVLHAAESRGC